MCQSSNSLPFILFSIVVMLLAQGAVQKGFQLQAFSPARDYVFCMNSTKKEVVLSSASAEFISSLSTM